MKYFLDPSSRRGRMLTLAMFVLLMVATVALGELPPWMRNIDSNSAVETVFFRMMSLPTGAVAFRRGRHVGEVVARLALGVREGQQHAAFGDLRQDGVALGLQIGLKGE